jgi:protein ImuB
MRRVAFILLPFWPTDRWRRLHDDDAETPFALTQTVKSALRLSSLNAAALRQGLVAGLPLADARAMVPALRHAPRPTADEDQDLMRLARWCACFSPFTAPAPDAFEAHGLMLDITGVSHLFGGEAGLLATIQAKFSALGLTARVAAADTIGIAAALAGFDRRAQTGFVAPCGVGLDAIAALPPAALRLPAALADNVRALGLKRIADVMGIARASLARRFGPVLLQRLDQASGAAAEPLDPLAPATRLFVLRRLLEPIITPEALETVVRDCVAGLCAQARDAGAGVRRVRLDLFTVGQDTLSLTAGFAHPQTNPAQVFRVLHERIGRTLQGRDFGFGIEAALLTAVQFERLEAHAVDLDPTAARALEADHALMGLLDNVRARLGADAVIAARGRESHMPERAQARTGPAPVQPRSDRPLFLLPRPEPIEALAETPDGPPRSFRWRRLSFRVARAQGPERIAEEWWRTLPSEQNSGKTRDYFCVETQEGRRLWLYREGLYGVETDRPRWFVHGSFP